MLFNDARPAAADDDIARGTLAAAEWTSDDREDNWLISYADLLSVIFTMVVLLFGRMTVVAQQPAAEPAAPEPAAEVATAPDTTPIVRIVSEPATAPEPVAEAAPEQSAVAPDDRSRSQSAPPPDLASSVPRRRRISRKTSLCRSRTVRAAKTASRTSSSSASAGRSPRRAASTVSRSLFPRRAVRVGARGAPGVCATGAHGSSPRRCARAAGRGYPVEGHTDNVPVQGGQFASNWDLASARANAVARYLLEHGFEPSRLQSVSYADTRPVAGNDSEAGRAANRRVELQISFIDRN